MPFKPLFIFFPLALLTLLSAKAGESIEPSANTKPYSSAPIQSMPASPVDMRAKAVELRAFKLYESLTQRNANARLIAPLGNNIERLKAAQKEFRIVIGMDFADKDKNHDGVLPFEEYAHLQLNDWFQADPLKKGFITEKEWDAYYEVKILEVIAREPKSEPTIRASATKNLARAFHFLDSNNNHQLTRDEFLKRLVDSFSALDKNKDGLLSISEYTNGVIPDEDLQLTIADAKARLAIEAEANQKASKGDQ